MGSTAGSRPAGRTARGRRPGWPALALCVSLALAVPAAAVSPAAAAGPGWRACLSCHDNAALATTTAKGERLALAVVADELSGSAHRGLECRACHPGVKLEEHPGRRKVASIEAYRTAASRVCLSCHPADGLRASAQHAAVVFEDQQLRCVECHGSHGVKKVAAWRKSGTVNEYCLSCHAHALSVQLAGGSSRSLAVDRARIRASVHPDHDCVDCHAGFSQSAHPAAEAGDRNRRSLASARMCARCHGEKMSQVEGSIHFKLLRSGVAGAPGCTDCHSAHDVAPAERFATLTGSPCRTCHSQIFEAYAGSMHGKARESGSHFAAPLCSECHHAHDVRGSAQPALVRAACMGCHPAAVGMHAAWLPNAALHLDAVSCAVCHAPKAKRVVALRLVEEGTGRQLSVREVGDLLGGDAAAAFDPEGTGVDGLSLWSAMRKLESRRQASAAKLHVVGRLEVARGIDAHRLAGSSEAVRSCEVCHESGSTAFNQVALTLARDDGRPRRYNGAPGMLTDAASALSIHGFYALGATRNGLLDWLLVLAVAGGLAVVAAHLSMRLWSARAGKGRG